MNNTKLYRAIIVRYLAPTNTLGSRIKLHCPRFNQSKTFDYSPSGGMTLDQTVSLLQRNTVKIACVAELKNEYVIMISDFDISLKDLV